VSVWAFYANAEGLGPREAVRLEARCEAVVWADQVYHRWYGGSFASMSEERI